jgi:kynurenine formamidase
LDAPLHFDSGGRGVDELEARELMFEHVVLIDVPALPGELIGPEHVGHARNRIAGADIVLLRTHFEQRRGEKAYVERNPGLAPDLAEWLRTASGGLRAIGVDLISISAAEHREAGRDAHRRFLAPAEGRPLLLIEDMSLVDATPNIARLWVLPLRVRGSDGAPCTIVAEVAA